MVDISGFRGMGPFRGDLLAMESTTSSSSRTKTETPSPPLPSRLIPERAAAVRNGDRMRWD